MKKLLYLSLAFSLVLTSCSDDKKEIEKEDLSIKLNKTEYSLTPDAEVQIEATAKTNINFSTENEFVATVTSTGNVTAQYVGETNILLKNEVDTKTVKITVNPKTNLFPDPSTDFRKATKSDLIKKHGKPTLEKDSVISYSNYSTNAPTLLYVFDNNDKLKGVLLFVKTSVTTQMGNHLRERYYPITYDDDYFYFINALESKKATKAVVASVYNISNWMLAYVDLSESTKAQNTKSQEVSFISKEHINMLLSEMSK